jgi:hypothetical protein
LIARDIYAVPVPVPLLEIVLVARGTLVLAKLVADDPRTDGGS